MTSATSCCRRLSEFRPPALLDVLARTTVTAEANFDVAVNGVLAANPNVKVVVGTILDLTQTPLVQAAVGALWGAGAAGVEGDERGDLDLQRACSPPSPPVTIAWPWPIWRPGFSQIPAEAVQNGGSITVGGVPIDVVTPGNGYNHLLLGDAYHPGTVAQGLIADTVVGGGSTARLAWRSGL